MKSVEENLGVCEYPSIVSLSRRSFSKCMTGVTAGVLLSPPYLVAEEFSSNHVWDVIVCGGGPSGIMAAWAAAREGVKCLLIEKQSVLGGMATSGLVGPVSKFRFDSRQIIGGLPWRFVSILKQRRAAITDLPSGNIPFEAEVYAAAAAEILARDGVSIMLESEVSGVSCRPDGNVESVTVRSASQQKEFRGRFFIDATGTGAVVSRTSCPAPLRASPEELQPMSLMFRLDQVDTGSINVLMSRDRTRYANATLRKALRQATDDKRIALFGGPWVVFGSTIRPGSVSVNATRYSGDATNADVLLRARRAMKSDIKVMIDVFRKAHPAFAECRLRDIAPVVGIRESRGIIGEFTLTAEDVLQGRRFDDSVALGGHPLDMHSAKDNSQHAPFLERPYQIPLRCLMPKGCGNLLVSGALISADRTVFSSVRVQAQCMATGQAAGVTAALCVSSGGKPSRIDVKLVLDKLAALQGYGVRP